MRLLKLYKRFHTLLKPFLGRFFLLNCFSVVQAVLQIALAVVSKFVVDAALAQNGTLPLWGGVLLGVLVLLMVNYGFYNWFTGSTNDKCTATMRHALLRAAACGGDDRLQAYHSGELLSRGMEDVRTACDGLVTALPVITGQVTRLAGAFVSVMMIYPPVAPVLLLAGGVVVLVSVAVKPVNRARQKQVRQTEDQVMAGMQEDLQQLELIKSLQAEKSILQRFAGLLKSNLRALSRRRRWTVGSNTFVVGASYFGTGVLLLWGAAKVAANALSYGSLTAMTQLLNLFRAPVMGLSGQITRVASVEVAAQRLDALLHVPETKPQTCPDVQVKAVVFRDVTFAYADDEAPVLDGFNATFTLDQWACLTGISGKGKSTLFKLILGLYTPQQGSVYLRTDKGDIPCSEQTRHLFAYVPQDYALFSGTILENLQLIAPDADESQRRSALMTAEADFVYHLAHGEQTHLKEHNAGLSKGQLQRIAIARAVLMRRPILLLDECTSALDAETEAKVLQNLHTLNTQAILVTHRPEAVEQLDQISLVQMEE